MTPDLIRLAREAEVRERPILFSGAMVRAILAGTKTQTRRVVKPQPPTGWDRSCWFDAPVWGWTPRSEPSAEWHKVRCPYGQPGDRLWVRETWGYRCSSSTPTAGKFLHTVAYRADDARHTYGPMPMDGVSLPRPRARREGEPYEQWMDYLTAYWRQWRPSIHMPRWASRITLEITGVRVERLQDISEADAIAEGIDAEDAKLTLSTIGGREISGPVAEYSVLWESINGPGSWDDPWVWVVEFKRTPDAAGGAG